MMHLLTLNCWIRSEEAESAVQVKISNTETVFALQKAIKNEKHAIFCNVDAYSLDLYKPKNPVSVPYKENLSKFILSEHAECLSKIDPLSMIFPESPPESDIHVIVDAPLKIVCWLRGSDLTTSCSIPIQPDEDLADFVRRIKDAFPDLKSVDHQHIRLYRVLGDESEFRESLGKPGDGERLKMDSSAHLRANFLSVPVLAPFRIVIEVATSTGADPIALAREKFIEAGAQRKLPFYASAPSEFRKTQDKEETRIPCGRPRGPEEVIPVTLLHPVFGQFTDDCYTGTPTEEDNRFVGQLADIMSEFYENDKKRAGAVHRAFKAIVPDLHFLTSVHETSYVMTSGLSVVEQTDLPPYFIGEFRNEMGSSSSDPYMEGVLHYMGSAKMCAPILSKHTMPCLLLIVFGPYMMFAGAAWNVRPVVQILSTPLVFNYHSTNIQIQLNLARHMAAFRKAQRTLNMHYEDLYNGLAKEHQFDDDKLFPYYTEFTSLDDGSAQSFRYTRQEDEGGKKTRLVFFGTLEGDPTVQLRIKFTKRYSKEAHLHCANMGFAPKLRGFEALPDEWYMVVMDDLAGYDSLAKVPKAERLPRSTLDALGTQLGTLHARHLVHGDLREGNMLVNEDRTTLMVVDFDWAGVEGDVLYPPFVNYYVDVVRRPQGARDGLPVMAAHDVEMLGFVVEARA